MRTETLAQARTRGAEQTAPRPLSHRIREARSECVNALHGIRDALDWFIERTANAAKGERLIALRMPFIKLLERYPASPGRPADEPTEPPASDTPPGASVAVAQALS